MLIYWRFRNRAPCAWKFGFMTHLSNGLVRMGLWNGDTTHGPVVDRDEIETRSYS